MTLDLFRWLIVVCAALVAACGAQIRARMRGRPDGIYLQLVIAVELAVVLGYLGENLASTLPAKLAWDSLQLALDGALAVAFFCFACVYVGRPLQRPRAFAAFILVPTSLASLLFATSPWHGLTRRGAHLVQSPQLHLDYPFEPFDFIVFLYMYVLLFAATGQFVRSGLWRHRVYRRQIFTLTANVLAPAVGGVLAFSGFSFMGERDVTPILCSFGTLLTTIGLYREVGLALSPLARDLWVELQADAILVIDAHGRVVDLNRVAAELIVHQTGEVAPIGQRLDDIIPSWAPAKQAADAHESRRELDARIWELRRFPVDVGILLVARDVTGLAASERALSSLNQELERRVAERSRELAQAAEENRRLAAERGHDERMEMLGRLAGGVAHDFNNLLTVILAASSVLRESEPSPASQEVLNDLEQATESAALVTRQLLTFSRSGAGKIESTEIGEALGRAAKLLERLLGERHPLRHASTSDPSFVRIDPGQLEQCVMNLVINARDALPNGGEIELLHHGEMDDTGVIWAVITVADRGTGMSEEVRAHIFDAFYTTKPRGQGTGLGLSNLHAVVEGAGGTVRLESKPGQGTRFELRLPRSSDLQSQPAPPKAFVPRGFGHVVLVEDVERLRSLVSDDLRRHGYEVSSFASAEEALAGLDQSSKLDVLVSDVILPGLDGVQLAEQLEARYGPLRAIFTTGYSGDASLDLDRRAQHRLLLKPYRTQALLQALYELMAEGSS